MSFKDKVMKDIFGGFFKHFFVRAIYPINSVISSIFGWLFYILRTQ